MAINIFIEKADLDKFHNRAYISVPAIYIVKNADIFLYMTAHIYIFGRAEK